MIQSTYWSCSQTRRQLFFSLRLSIDLTATGSNSKYLLKKRKTSRELNDENKVEAFWEKVHVSVQDWHTIRGFVNLCSETIFFIAWWCHIFIWILSYPPWGFACCSRWHEKFDFQKIKWSGERNGLERKAWWFYCWKESLKWKIQRWTNNND